MDFELAIPSKGRAGLISSHKIFKSATLYIPESELMQYSIYKNRIVTIPIEVKGITATRNWILKHNENKNVFFLDDDFQYGGYIERTDLKYKVKRVTEEYIYINEIKKLFEVSQQSNSKIFGFFTVGNNLTNYAYSPFLFNGVCLGSCMGIINDGTYYFDESFEVKEDYELTLRHISERGITVRSNILFMQHEHTQLRGGCRDSKRIDKEKSAIKRLIKMYPGMIKEAKHRGTSFAIQLNL
jgi:glycosyltransferase involved in cell wall biosynthesis